MRFLFILLFLCTTIPRALAPAWGIDWSPDQLVLRLQVEAAGIDAPLTRFYLGGGTWAIDPWETRVGHLQGTGWLSGNMALGGHSAYPDGTPGIFGRLNHVRIGDTLTLVNARAALHFTVTEVRTVAYDDLSVLYPTSAHRLTLITCDEASYDPATGLYAERLVVVAARDERYRNVMEGTADE